MTPRPDPPRKWASVFYPLPDYPYFERTSGFDSARAFAGNVNLMKAAWMADAAMLAYGRAGRNLIPPGEFARILERAGFQQFELLGDWSGGAKGTQAYFAQARDFAVLAFRGTEKNDWEDLAADLATWPVAEDMSVPSSGESIKTMFHLPSARGVFDRSRPAVHRGFQAALNQVWPVAAEKLAAYRARSNNEIFLTGHSLGAALATIAVSRFGGGNASLYTFGSPRVGNSAFLEKVRQNATLGSFRFVDNNDLVTRVPPALMWYAHAPASLYRIGADGGIQDLTSQAHPDAGDIEEVGRDLKCLAELRFPIDDESEPPADLYDHSPGRYCNCIWNQSK